MSTPTHYSPKRWLDLSQTRWRADDTDGALDAWERGVWLLDGAARAGALRELDWSLEAGAADAAAEAAALYRRALAVAHMDGEPGQVDALAELLPDLRAARAGLRTRTRWLLVELLRPALGEGSPELARERAALEARLGADALDPADAPPIPAREVPRGAVLELLEAAEALAESAPLGRSLGLAETAWLYAGLGEHLRALQAADEAERWWSSDDTDGMRSLTQPLVAAVRQRVSGADAGDADFEAALDRLRTHPTAQTAATVVRCLDRAYPDGEADARWVEAALALTAALDPRERLAAVADALPAWRRFGAARAVRWAQAALAGNPERRLAQLALTVLADLDALDAAQAEAWLTGAAADPYRLRTSRRALRLAVDAVDPKSSALTRLEAACDGAPLAALLLEASRLARLAPAQRDGLSGLVQRALAGEAVGTCGNTDTPRLALEHLLALLPGSPGGEALLRETCGRMLDDPGAYPHDAIAAGLRSLAEGRERDQALKLLHTLTPKLHVLLGGTYERGAQGALEALTLLAPEDLPAQLRACASVNARSAAQVGRAAAAAGLADVTHEAFARVWPVIAQQETHAAWDCVQAALLAASCAIPDACGLARRALTGIESHHEALGPIVAGLVIPMLERVVQPGAGPDAALSAARERAQLRAGLWV